MNIQHITKNRRDKSNILSMRKSNRPQHKIDKEYEEIGIPCKNGELYQVDQQ
jgi:hypothetical protein